MTRLLAVSVLLAACCLACSSGDDNGAPTDTPATGACDSTGSVAVGSKPWAVATDRATNRIYSADEFDNTVTILDLCTHELIATLDSGIGPNSISIDHESGVAFVSNFNSNEVTVIDGDAVLRNIPVGLSPWSVLADEDAHVAYVANSQSGSISVVDSTSPDPIDAISGLQEPRGLARLERILYVAEAAANRVRAINLDTGEFAGEVAVGQRPQGLAIDPAANELWVTNVDDASVSVIDLGTMAVIATIPVGVSPLQVAVDSVRHRAYTADSFADTITVIDTEQPVVINTYTGVQRPWDVEMADGGLYIYVANSATGEIIILKHEDLEPEG